MKIDFRTFPCVPPEVVRLNVAHALSLGLPFWGETGSGALAVVGRGQSASAHIEDLRNWPSDVWAINGAAQWCRDHGIRATLFSLDPHTDLIGLCDGIEDALLSIHCATGALDRLIGQGSRVTLFHEGVERGIATGTTTATCALCLAPKMGFTSLVYFGCEGDFQQPPHPVWFRVRVNGQSFKTKADYFLQSKIIADAIREFPFFVSERSGGLVRALASDPEWDAECVSPEMGAAMTGSSGRIPLCEEGANVCPTITR